jgi:hypothetical protein
VRRLIALLVMLAFAAATAAPAIAACRMRAQEKECCCTPAPANSLCAPDCCDLVKAGHSLADVATHLRGFSIVAAPTIVVSHSSPAACARSLPTARMLVGLHERAAPRLPLRI